MIRLDPTHTRYCSETGVHSVVNFCQHLPQTDTIILPPGGPRSGDKLMWRVLEGRLPHFVDNYEQYPDAKIEVRVQLAAVVKYPLGYFTTAASCSKSVVLLAIA